MGRKPSPNHLKNHNNSVSNSVSDVTPNDVQFHTTLSSGGVSYDVNKETDLIDNPVSKSDSYSMCRDSNSDPTLPNGYVSYDVDKQIDLVTQQTLPYSVRWKFFLHNSKKNKEGPTAYWKCLGLYTCNYIGCSFVEAPRVPDKKTKNATPKPPKKKMYSSSRCWDEAPSLLVLYDCY